MPCFTETIYRLLLILLGLTVAAASAAGAETGEWAVVEATGLKLREAPTVESRVLGVLPEQTRVPVIGQSPGWVKVVVDGTVGYLSEGHVRRLPDKPEAPGPSEDRMQTLQRQARDIDRQITQRKAEVAQISRQEQAVITDLDAVEQQLGQTRAALAKLRSEQDALRSAIDETDRAVARLEAETRQVSDMAARRLAALYKLNWLGRVQILAAAGTIHDFVIREKALKRILAADEAVLERFHQQRRKLEDLLADQARQHQRMASLAAELKDRLQAFDAEQARRNDLLARIRHRKALAQAAVEGLKQAAARLDETMHRLNAPPAENAAEPVFGDTPFHARKGLLKMPVSGKIIHFFGPYLNRRFNVTNVRGGIDIQAEKGAQIRAVHGGRVLYADWFKGYGNLMIIDHGDAYYTVYAHMEEMLKPKGAAVKDGDVIATVGDTGSLEGPMLYFEVRHHGKPVDPTRWLKTG
ncbi:MAG: peptidoglycan DD-metalloendopeptidase family protein [Desulfobacteraceae bacterium]|nr:peptidoglycan DD-metalloendopeptidase family protein [Desulfobacteraceae bacterium]